MSGAVQNVGLSKRSVPLPNSGTTKEVYNNEYNQFMVCGGLFECPAKYAPIKPIGKGAYGVVWLPANNLPAVKLLQQHAFQRFVKQHAFQCPVKQFMLVMPQSSACASALACVCYSSARNLESNERIAIKKISNAFDNAEDSKRTLREVQLLAHLHHENIVAIRDIIPPTSGQSFRDVYIVYELMDTDLHQIIRSPQQLSEDHVSYFIYQVLRGLKYVHSANVLHRDLKPSNLLVNANCDLKIGDFGLARTSNEQQVLTEYVVTRWYRAPELLLSCSDYTAAIDVWSVGCILAELLGRKPLFPGKDYIHQLNLITKALDLLSRMLVFNPYKRITVDEALAHPYLAALHDASDEPVAVAPFMFDIDSKLLDKETTQELMWKEVLRYHPGLANTASKC
eukprot:jgi/Chrzof1/2372/Cz11g12200.t1_MAPK4